MAFTRFILEHDKMTKDDKSSFFFLPLKIEYVITYGSCYPTQEEFLER